MSMKEWMELDIDEIELESVTELEKKRIKNHILKNHKKKKSIWKPLAFAASMLLFGTIATAFAFPSVASQIPFMSNVISYLDDDFGQYTNFEAFSSELGLVDSDNGVAILIDNAVYDGTNIVVSYALETDKDLGKSLMLSGGGNWFDVKGATGMRGSDQIIQIDDKRYVGVAEFTPTFKDGIQPHTIEVTWKPKAIFNYETDLEIKGDWSFQFSLDRIDGTVLTLNETTTQDDVSFTVNSLELTNVSTILSYKQFASEQLRKSWLSITPTFIIKDDLGNIYLNRTGGGGQTSDGFITYTGTTSFGSIKEGATKLYIETIAVASLENGRGHEEIPLGTIVVDLVAK